ncbi:MAG: hypothetical protein AAGA58_04070 [Verrucomicrobiota bacterium]
MSVSLSRFGALILFALFSTGSAFADLKSETSDVNLDLGVKCLSTCEQLGFNKEQRTEVVRIMRRHSSRIRSLCSDLRTVINTKPGNDTEEKQLTERVTAIKTQLDTVQLRMRADLRKIATADQRKRWDELELAQTREAVKG